jgi:cobalt/nickel transport protein
MDKITRNIIIVLAVLIVLTPLGLLATGETFGEWNLEELKEKIGYVPSGLGGLAPLWNAPLADYGFPGLGNASVGYVLSAIIGVLICVGILYLVGKVVVKNE